MSAFSFTLVINSPAESSVTFTPTPGLTAPVPANAALGTLVVAPAGWSGVLALDAAVQAAGFSVQNAAGVMTLMNSNTLAAGSYNVSGTANP